MTDMTDVGDLIALDCPLHDLARVHMPFADAVGLASSHQGTVKRTGIRAFGGRQSLPQTVTHCPELVEREHCLCNGLTTACQGKLIGELNVDEMLWY